MAKIKPTLAQNQAITSRGSSLLVSANAGSGKTRVLTERLMSYIDTEENPKSIESFLVITYTRAAAAELRERISEELSQRVALKPQSKWLKRQTALVQSAKIGTIHSFLSQIIREQHYLVDLAPNFAIADDSKVQKMRAMALTSTLDRAYETANPSFFALADTLGAGRDDKRLAEIILKLHDKIQSHARPDKWIAEQIDLLSKPYDNILETIWAQELCDYAKNEAIFWADELETCLNLMNTAEFSYIYKAYGESFEVSAKFFRKFAEACERDWDDARLLLPIEFPRLKSLRNPADPDFVNKLKDIREKAKESAKKFSEIFIASGTSMLEDLENLAPQLMQLLIICRDFNVEYTKLKCRKNLLDYSDLEHYAVDILLDEDNKPTAIANDYSKIFTEVMVDEYQDISGIQELILTALSNEGDKLFMVGDVKQSIYRFRLADPTIFISKFLNFADVDYAIDDEPKRVLLRENFRSNYNVLAAANSVFSNIMSSSLGELDYNEDTMLVSGSGDTTLTEKTDFYLLSLPDVEEDEESTERNEAEAYFVAMKIKKLVREGYKINDKGNMRAVTYGDFAILMRSANKTAPVYRRILTNCAVPVMSDSVGGFFRSPEIISLISYLAIIDNPHQDIALISALRSSFLGFSPDELSKIRACDKKSDYFEALKIYAEKSEKARDFLETLNYFRHKNTDCLVCELIREVYEKLDCLSICSAEFEGMQATKNLNLLLEVAVNFESSLRLGLRDFLLTLKSMEERGEEPQSAVETTSGCVQILSIHKSKGLEFPVVFLCDTARKFNKTDLRSSILVHPELGLGGKIIDIDRRIEYPSLARLAIAKKLENELLSEEIRLLYVAMTRARDKLIITGAPTNPVKTIETIEPFVKSPMSANILRGMSAPCQWLVAAALAEGEAYLKIHHEIVEIPNISAPIVEKSETKAEDFSPAHEAIFEKLSYVYPHEEVNLPTKISATSVKSNFVPDPEAKVLVDDFDFEFDLPNFRKKEKLSAADIGTATHIALSAIDFSRCEDLFSVQKQVLALVETGKLSEQEGDAVNCSTIDKFINSELGSRLKNAKTVLREFPFTLLCKASEFFDTELVEDVLLQGVVDCCFVEDDGLVIIDYKTDKISKKYVSERAEKYRPQLLTYKMAMERIYNMPVKECLLYFLNAETVVKL